MTPARLTGDLIRKRLDTHGCHRGPGPAPAVSTALGDLTRTPQPAAVLLPLYCANDAWHLVFIRRAEHAEDRHSGEVGFPGGRREDLDADCTATALREAEEEIGLPRDQVRVLGVLPPMHTVSQFLVTPVVGQIPWPQPLRAEPREVSRIFSIPLAWLGAADHHRVRPYPAAGHPQAHDVVVFDEYDGERLWGVTARITLDFLTCLTRPGAAAW